MNRIQWLLEVALLLIAGWIGYMLHEPQCPECPEFKPGKDSIIYRDTSLEHHGTTRPHHVQPAPHVVDLVADSGYYPCPTDSIRVYLDTLFGGHMFVRDSVLGERLGMTAKFTALPEIHTVDTLLIREQIKKQFFVGLQIYGNQLQQGAMFNATYVNGIRSASFGYDPINRSFMIGAGVRLYKK